MRTLAVGEMMTVNPVTCKSEDNVIIASKLFKKYKISSLIVCDNGIVRGILTVDDIVRKVVASNQNLELTKVKNVMITDVIHVEPTMPIEKVIEVLNSNNISQVPVMQDKKLCGFVTMKDILRLEPALFEFFTDRLHHSSERRKKFIEKYANVDLDDI